MKEIKISRRFVFNIALLLSVPAFTIHLQAQHGWSVNPADFENSMQVTAGVSFDGALVTSGTLGAFVEDECRGFVDALEFGPDLYLFDFLVYSNQSAGEILTFRYYNPDDGLIYDVDETIGFGADTREGDAINPLVFTVTVNNVNEPPVVESPLDDLEFDEGFGTATVDLTNVFSDPDGDELVLSAVSGNTGVVTVTVTGTTLTITETGIGSSTLTVTATDNGTPVLSVSDAFTLTVINVNDAPVVVSPISSISRNEGFGTVNINLGPVFTDPDGDAITYSAVSSNTNVVTVSISGTTLTVREAGLGLSTITVTASDGLLSTDDQFTFTIINVNDAPEVVQPIGNRSYDEGFSSVTINLSTRFSDPDGDVLTFKAVSSNTGVVTVSVSGSILTIREVGLGTSDITVTATDDGDGNLSVSDQFTVNVNNVNDAPVVENPIADREVDEYFGSIDINISNVFSDPDAGDILSYTAISSNSAVVTVSVEGSILTITEVGPGEAVITVTASDGSLSVEDQFSITVIDINAAPELVEPIPDQNIVENIGSAELDLDAYFSDPHGDLLVYSVVLRDIGIVSYELDQSLLLLTPVDTGSTMVTITATDPEGLMAADSFMVHVEKELMFIVQHGSRRLQNRDTIILCNDAGQITVKVITRATWGFTNNHLWMALEIMHDSALSLAFSPNLTGGDRIGDVTLFDEQGHVIQFFVKQTEHCLTNVVPGDRLFDLKMYPNPVEGQLFIDTGERLRRGMKVEVIDQQGRLLFVEEVEEDAPDVPLEIDMRGYTAGPYFIRISDDRGSFIRKIIKQ